MTDQPKVPVNFTYGMVALQCQQIENSICELRTLLLQTDFFTSLDAQELTVIMTHLNDAVDVMRAIRDDVIEAVE